MVSREELRAGRELDLHALRYVDLVERHALERGDYAGAVRMVRGYLHKRVVAALLEEGEGVGYPAVLREGE